ERGHRGHPLVHLGVVANYPAAESVAMAPGAMTFTMIRRCKRNAEVTGPLQTRSAVRRRVVRGLLQRHPHHLGDGTLRQPRLAAPTLGDHPDSVDTRGREPRPPCTHESGAT